MSDDLQSPNLVEKGKNLAKFSWDLIKYIGNNQESLFASDEIYRERLSICKSCDKYMELENECAECGCYIPMKAKIVLDSCPLEKWTANSDGWDDKFNAIMKDMDK